MNKPFKKNAMGFFSGLLLVVSAFFLVFFVHSCGLAPENADTDPLLPAEYEAIETDTPFVSDSIYHVVETPPRFPGGEEGRMAFLQEHLRYPNEARLAGIQGTVFVQFVVLADGRIDDVKILRGIGGGCDEETLRVIREMPAWEPGRNSDGQAVHTRFNMPVRFALKTDEAPNEAQDMVILWKGDVIRVTEGTDLDALIPMDEIGSLEVLAGEDIEDKYGVRRVIRVIPKE